MLAVADLNDTHEDIGAGWRGVGKDLFNHTIPKPSSRGEAPGSWVDIRLGGCQPVLATMPQV